MHCASFLRFVSFRFIITVLLSFTYWYTMSPLLHNTLGLMLRVFHSLYCRSPIGIQSDRQIDSPFRGILFHRQEGRKTDIEATWRGTHTIKWMNLFRVPNSWVYTLTFRHAIWLTSILDLNSHLDTHPIGSREPSLALLTGRILTYVLHLKL